MKLFLIKRIGQMIPVLLGITVLVSLLLHMIPGDPAITLLGPNSTPDEIERIRNTLGLNEPILTQIYHYLTQVMKGDLGTSIFQKESVLSLVLKAFPATLELTIVSIFISLLIAIPLGIFAAIKRNTLIDYVSMFFAQIGVSMPIFWTGILLILLFSLKFNLFPSFGREESLIEGLYLLFTKGNFIVIKDAVKSIILPAVTLGVMGSALITRMIRSTMLEVLESDYIRTARSKGTKEYKVILKHALRNALLPVITIVGLEFGNLIGGAVVIETVFAWPGLGRLIITAIGHRDFPIVQGAVLIIALTFMLINLLVDILYTIINPKVRRN